MPPGHRLPPGPSAADTHTAAGPACPHFVRRAQASICPGPGDRLANGTALFKASEDATFTRAPAMRIQW